MRTIRPLTQEFGMPQFAFGLYGLLVAAVLFISGCQLAPSRKLYKPPAAGQVLDASSQLASPSDQATTDLTNALGNNQQFAAPGRADAPTGQSMLRPQLTHPSQPTNHLAQYKTIQSSDTAVAQEAPRSRKSSNDSPAKIASGAERHMAATVQYAQQGTRFQLSPFAIVRGQSGWVPSNPGTGQSGAATPGYLTDATPSVSRYQPPPTYGSAVAPGTYGGQGAIAPGVSGYTDGSLDVPNMTAPGGYQPKIEIAPLDVYVQEKRTGRIILGGSVNSDLGVAGQLIIDERNFDIRAIPGSWAELFSGYAFRGAGQSFRVELMPGNQVERYTANWTTPNLFGYMPYSLSLGGFYFTRQYQDWTERRLGGRIGLGYNVTKDLSIGTEIRGENVKISNPRVTGVQKLDSVLGKNELYSVRLSVAHDTRDSAFLATQGALLQLIYDQAFGDFDYPQGQVNYSRYFRVHERADGMGRHVLASTLKVGFSGTQTPIFENFYAGGFSSMRGFRFRGASPLEGGVQVGGRFSFLGSLEYMFPLTADEMLRGVAFVDYGTVEQNITIKEENFRVAPGLGLRISVPMLGPAPLAFDFSVPVAKADGDRTQLLSFYMGFTR